MNLEDKYLSKIKVLSEGIWPREINEEKIEEWLSNFEDYPADSQKKREHALFLLSHFIYFGDKQIRELLKALYRTLFEYPIIENIRRTKNNTLDEALIKSEYDIEINKTKFLGVGNPADSGTHLLYYFRQVNKLPTRLFIHSHKIFSRNGSTNSLRDPEIKRYVFIDDMCGSGQQAMDYSEDIIKELKRIKPEVETCYFVIFGTSKGLEEVRKTSFDKVGCIYELNETFKCFNDASRYFTDDTKVDKKFAKELSDHYGRKLLPSHPLGFQDGQLLLGFRHNVPDNTLPIIWSDDVDALHWNPIFSRWPKIEN